MSWSAYKSMHRSFKQNAWDFNSPPSRLVTISAGFHSQKFWGLLFPALEPWCGARTPCSLVDLSSQTIPSDFEPLHLSVGPTPFASLPLLPVWMWLLSYVLSYRSFSTQLSCGWFSVVVVL